MSEVAVANVISLILFSSVKLFWAPATCVISGYNFWQTIAITSSGGMLGITFFYFFGRWALTQVEGLMKKSRFTKPFSRRSKIFSKRNRRIIKIKRSLGMAGLIISTPAILSIPIGCVVAAKFYYKNRLTYPLLLVSTVAWCLILSLVAVYFKDGLLYL